MRALEGEAELRVARDAGLHHLRREPTWREAEENDRSESKDPFE